MAKKHEMGGGGIFDFKMIIIPFIFMLKTANISKNLTMLINMAEEYKV